MSHLRTFTGKTFDPLNPHPDDIDILDIAQGLSNECRFGGQVASFYSVAQHSGVVASILKILDPQYEAEGLAHDASEAYLKDIPAPLKHSPAFMGYARSEDILLAVVFDKYDLVYPVPATVKIADKATLFLEEIYVRGRSVPELIDSYKQGRWCANSPDEYTRWLNEIPPIIPMTPQESREYFLDYWNTLHHAR